MAEGSGDHGDDDLFAFICSLGISSEELQQQKIDRHVIQLMTDEELGKYIKSHGDRLKIRNFIRNHIGKNTTLSNQGKLISRLRAKLSGRLSATEGKNEESGWNDPIRNSHLKGNAHATKTNRLIEIGWIHIKGHTRTQVRTKQGGGTRKVTVPKVSTKQDVLHTAIDLFFPDGISPKGSKTDVVFDLCDYQQIPWKENITVSELYKSSKLNMLRFYLSSTEKDMDDLDELPDLDDIDSEDLSTANKKENNPTDIIEAAASSAGLFDFLDSDDIDMPFLSTDDAAPSTAELDDTLIYNSLPSTAHTLTLHRGHIMKELNSSIKSVDPFRDIISIQVVLPNGDNEVAEDSGGVTRDVLTEYWETFYEQNTLGTDFKVPCIRHDYGTNEWTAVAKVIVFGWRSVGYFPIRLSLPFAENCIFGTHTTDLKEEFLRTLPKGDSEVLKSSLSEFPSTSVDDLMDVLDTHDIKTVPNENNLDRIVQEIAHKEIIQAGMFIIDCWRPVLKHLGISREKLLSIYEELVPSSRRVIQRLQFPQSMTQDETTTANHLKRFIRELDKSNLGNFLRFCTGSDILLCQKIEITFVINEGIGRRPVAHTCSCLVELPKTYESYPVFRSEFLSILKASVWVMDII